MIGWLRGSQREQVMMTGPTVVNLNALVREVEPLIRRLLGETVHVTLSLASDLGSVRVDAGQFQQVILNLVVNSRDAMPSGGTLTLRTRSVVVDGRSRGTRPGRYSVVEIEDTGEGMATPEKGSGLSTAHGIVKQSGGDVVVSSEPGHGTTMAVWLPIAEQTSDNESPAEPKGSSPGHETILVVDDDAGVRTLTRRVLERVGYVVRTAGSGTEALALFDAHEPVDLVVSDVEMPGMGGRELAEEIWRRRPDMRVIFMTGYTEDVIIRHGVLERGLHLISKPYTTAQLTGKVREVLDS